MKQTKIDALIAEAYIKVLESPQTMPAPVKPKAPPVPGTPGTKPATPKRHPLQPTQPGISPRPKAKGAEDEESPELKKFINKRKARITKYKM